MDKVVASFADAVADLGPGNTIGIAGFGVIHGFPIHLIAAVRAREELRDLTIVCNSLGRDPVAHPVAIVKAGQASRLVAAFSARAGGVAGAATSLSPVPLEVELVPQGVGLPTMVSDHLDGRDVVLHAENGILGYGTRLAPDDADPDYYNAGAEPVSLRPGASVFDSTEAFEIARSGRLTAVVLGAFQVDQRGSFANWTTPQMGGGAIGGAMDLLVRPGTLVIAMWHCERSGQSKIVNACRYDVTGTDCVDLIVTDIAVIERDGRGLVLRECAPGFAPGDIVELTEVPLVVDLWLAPPAGSSPAPNANLGGITR